MVQDRSHTALKHKVASITDPFILAMVRIPLHILPKPVIYLHMMNLVPCSADLLLLYCCDIQFVTMSQKQLILTDCQYNIAKQLEKKLEFVWHAEGYIKDAEKEGNQKCAEVFREIKADEERHARMLKELLNVK
jgi:hypothetical protein